MTISIWRYSHLALAISSFLFIALASITGIILAFEPVSQKIQPYQTEGFSEMNVAETIENFRSNYDEVFDIAVDDNQFVVLNAIDQEGNDVSVYANPKTGKKIAEVGEKNEFFQWVTNLHRSLFLKETGRFIIGLVSFLLLLIAVSGTVLVIQRQRGIKRFFTKIIKENFFQYYHVVLGRWTLIPIIIIALTGTYLSLVKFNIFPEQKISHNIDFDKITSEPKKEIADFKVFQDIPLSDVRKIEFPFSDDPEDYFTLQLTDREMVVNQFTGEILSEINHSKTNIFNSLSLDLHTGRASALWSIILAIACVNILFFIYSGFAITLKRMKNKLRNKYKKDDCKFIILVGSENGTTIRYANAVHNELLKNGEKSFIAELNNCTIYPKAEHLIVMTATYGLGDAPTNATKFLQKIKENQQPNSVHFSVLGFGSKAYPDFCQFAFEVHNALLQESWAEPLLEIHTVDDKSPDDFEKWTSLWSQKTAIPFDISPKLLNLKPKRTQQLVVTERTEIAHVDGSFLIRLKFKKKAKFTSGDLLAIYPANDHRERLYSIGKVNNEVQLSVKLHQNGLGSSFLYQLNPGDNIEAYLSSNKHFHFPKKSKSVVMISNGTGIAPFLGMIDENRNKIKTYLYCGFRDQSSYELYKNDLEKGLSEEKLTQLNLAYSRQGEKQYVKDLVLRDANLMAETLQNGGVIMICGSLAMQQMVVANLEAICLERKMETIGFYQSRNQLLTDCY
ncbi:sulfite reductase (NADPH) flavoprotein alpha-component [Flavobacterium arsenatis]|uniref:NADPH--hemoprotein reductase n=1 Tax=Flavobacterium arsenatis TaxID=1484332 RepID=A0ABU1TQ64_9FLAO|nr:PepSY domain-containing protein [Flavobacterium arsenatis]MDR6968124.1 sulfite reductase (NADPH) flavoprotein alpha-component [Flavobacterium arsenatis]